MARSSYNIRDLHSPGSAKRMGKVTVFTVDGCSACDKTKQLLTDNGAVFSEISLTAAPEWRALLFILANGELTYKQEGHYSE